MNATVIIQARMGATRLPGKVLKRLGDKTVLNQVINRVAACPRVHKIVVATTDSHLDNAVVAAVEALYFPVFRGSEQDVLARYYFAAKTHGATEIIVRVTADCPLFDPYLLTDMLDSFDPDRMDYLSNTIVRSYPQGLDAEIFTFAALERTFHEATELYQREHVTPYIYQHPELFRLQNYIGKADLSNHRWTLDTPEDFELIDKIYCALYPHNPLFTTAEILALFERQPELIAINQHIRQKKLGE
jgi:spore coat polysaccharide biosynthesis protein SpsF